MNFIFLFKTNIRIGTKSYQFTINRRRESNEGVERQKRLASHGLQLSKFDFVMILFSIVFFDTRSADCYFNAQEAIRFQRDLFKSMNRPHTRHFIVILANLFTKRRFKS